MKDLSRTVISISNGTFIRAILFGLLIIALVALKKFLLVLFTSIVIASFVTKAGNKLHRSLRVNRTLAVVSIYFISLAILFLVIYLFLPVLMEELYNLLVLVPNLKVFNSDALVGLKEFLRNFPNSYSVSGFVSGTQGILARTSQSLISALSVFFGGIVNFLIILVLSFYFSIQEKSVENFLRIVVPLKYEEYALSLWERAQRKIALWVKGQLVLGLIVGAITYIGLYFMGLKYALLIAVTAAIFELIPFGIVLAAIPAVSFAFSQGGFSFALLVGGFYFVVQQIESYVIAPLVVNKVVGISPIVVIIAILIGSILAGFWGLILAIPVVVVLLEFTDDLERKKVMETENLKNLN